MFIILSAAVLIVGMDDVLPNTRPYRLKMFKVGFVKNGTDIDLGFIKSKLRIICLCFLSIQLLNINQVTK